VSTVALIARGGRVDERGDGQGGLLVVIGHQVAVLVEGEAHRGMPEAAGYDLDVGRGAPDLIPGFLLARLALSEELHGQHLGGDLLAEALTSAALSYSYIYCRQLPPMPSWGRV
jgi:hypothetical protein